MNEPQLLIICSPSGAGKTTLTHRLLQERLKDFHFSISHTTRKPRKNEVDGKDYHFVSVEEFQKARDEDAFIEWAEVHGNFYGTGRSEIARAKELGKAGVIFDNAYQGARQIRAHYPDMIGIFILPPSLKELRRRLETRGTDANDVIERRFKKAQEEIEHYPFFDYLVVNEDIDRALAEISGIVYADECKREKRALLAEKLLRTPVE